MCLTDEMRREENLDVVVEYSNMKSETDLKSEFCKSNADFNCKIKIMGSWQIILIVENGNELMQSSMYPNARLEDSFGFILNNVNQSQRKMK
jgi:hypothetical protein